MKFANENNIPFAVYGGGHSADGSSSSDGGMVIDLRKLDNIEVDVINKTVSFGGGCRWSEVNDALWKEGLATVGGTVSHTGVGGLILGGGFGALTGKHGYTIDLLVSVEVVLADGSVIIASETENSDLFWAMRGAGAAFGVATKFTSRVFPQGNVWGGMLIYPLTELPTIIDACNEFIETTDGGQLVNLLLGFSPPPSELPVVILVVFHDGDKETAMTHFSRFLDADPIMNMTSMMPYPQFNTLGDQMMGRGSRRMTGASNFVAPLQLKLVQDVADVFFKHISENQDMKASIVGFEFIPNRVVRSVPLDAMAMANRGNYYNAATVMTWQDEARDNEVREFSRRLNQQIRNAGWKGDNTGGVGQYNNYIGDYDDISAEMAFGGNADRLIELKTKYDPENRFKKPWGLIPKKR